MIVYEFGIGWDYRFIVAEPTPNSIAQAIATVSGSVFSNNPTNRKNALSEKLASVQMLIDQGHYQEALDKLVNDIRAKMDGCYGGNPSNDWITDCNAQEQLLSLVDALIADLEGMI